MGTTGASEAEGRLDAGAAGRSGPTASGPPAASDPPPSGEPTEPWLVFRAVGETCAAPLVRVREIIRAGHVTRVPRMPPWMCGVFNLRGVVLPLVDLGPRIGQEATGDSGRSCVLVIQTEHEGESLRVGMLVESVSHIADAAAHEIAPAPRFGTALEPALLRGVGSFGPRPILLLDLDRILSPAHLLPSLAGSG